jgi:hypothetical protein
MAIEVSAAFGRPPRWFYSLDVGEQERLCAWWTIKHETPNDKRKGR